MKTGLRHIISGRRPADSFGERPAVEMNLTAARVGRVTACAPSWQTETLSFAGTGLVNQETSVGRRRRAEDCPPCLPVNLDYQTAWLAERGCPSRSASPVPGGWKFTNRPPLSAVTVSETCHPSSVSDTLRLGQPRSARSWFTLMEVLVSMGLLSLIVIVLMTVFSNTQSAFRAGVTQTDVMANGRATMDMLAADARVLTPSGNTFTNIVGGTIYYGAVNLAVLNQAHVNQLLPASGSTRTNIIQTLFFLGRENTKWKGIGYAVDVNNTHSIFPLYRFYEETNLQSNPGTLYTNFINTSITNTAVWSHLMDGVVHLVVRGYDTNGYWLADSNSYAINQAPFVHNTVFYGQFPDVYPNYGEEGFSMYSNTLPASLEIQLGVLEDTALRRLESLVNANYGSYTNYLAQQANRVEMFRERVSVPNSDPSAYQ